MTDLERRARQPEAESVTTLRELYAAMRRIRGVEMRLREILLGDEIVCPVHLYTGQEAVAVGVCSHLRDDDFVFSTHRSHGHYLAKGGDLRAMLAEIWGRDVGCSGGHGGSMHLTDPAHGFPGSSAIVAGSIPLAVGAALAFARQGTGRVTVAFFGDGAVNEGAWYESMNLAALWRAPVVFVCENNLYSTHMPVNLCLAGTEIYRKAEQFCLPGERIDGNDVLAVRQAAGVALARARNGDGPSLIECLTYRWQGHVGPNDDLDKGLRSPEELAAWKRRDPVANFATHLSSVGALDEAERASLDAGIEQEIDAALDYARSAAQPNPQQATAKVFRG